MRVAKSSRVSGLTWYRLIGNSLVSCLSIVVMTRDFSANEPRVVGAKAAVVARVRGLSGAALEVIDGVEEARLTGVGVLGGRDHDERTLCIDVGGGSTEVMLGEGRELVAARSVELGGLRLRQQIGGGGGDV